MVVAAFTKNIKAYSSLFSLTTIILVAALLIISTSLTLNGSYYYYFYHSALAVPHSLPPPSSLGPTIVNNETHLKIETVFTGLRSPTSMAFLGPNDILVLEKSQGTVQRIVNGNMLPKPLLKVPVATKIERGMLGIAIAKHTDGPTYIFLYYTQSGGGKNGDDRPGPG